jgi:hypothetical protein
MITFSIPCWLLWFVSGNLTMLIVIFAVAFIAGHRKQQAARQKSESDNHS